MSDEGLLPTGGLADMRADSVPSTLRDGGGEDHRVERRTSALVAGSIPRIGVWAWTFVGLVVTLVIVAGAVAALNEIMLPLTFAAVLAVVFKPLAANLIRRGLRPSASAGVVVLGLLGLVTVVAVATAQGVVGQLDQIGDSVDAAADEAQATLGVSQATIDAIHGALTSMAPTVQGGVLTTLVSGIGALVGIASGMSVRRDRVTALSPRSARPAVTLTPVRRGRPVVLDRSVVPGTGPDRRGEARRHP